MSAAKTERTKLRANALDRASTACLTVGVFAPIAATVYSSSVPHNPWIYVASSAVWILAAFALHYAAMNVLKALDT